MTFLSVGTGKTFLASKVIDHVRDRASGTSGVAYYYCDELSEHDRNTALPLLRNLLLQLATYDEDDFNKVANALRMSWEGFRLGASELSHTTCAEWLVTAVDLHDDVTLVLDGVDKLGTLARRNLFDSISHLLRRCASRLKVFLSSCDIEELVFPNEDVGETFSTITLRRWEYEEESFLPHAYEDMIKVLGQELGSDASQEQLRDIIGRSEGS